MKLSISITALGTVLLVLFFFKHPQAQSEAAEQAFADPSTTTAQNRAPTPTVSITRDVVRTTRPTFGAVPSRANLPKTLPATLPPAVYGGATNEAEREWARSKAQFRLTLLDAVANCLQGEDVGQGTVDIEVQFDNRGSSSVVTDVVDFPHDNPNAPELAAASKERVLGCVRDTFVNRPFEMHYPFEVKQSSVHRLAIKLPIERDPIYEFLKGREWDE